MRRPLHCLLVGFLVCSLSIDTARACWRLRHAHRGPAACSVEPPCGDWSRAVVVADTAVCHGWPASGWAEAIACGRPLPCSCGDFGVVVAEEYAIAEPAEHASIVAESPTLWGEIVTTQPAVPETAPAAETVGRPEPLQAVPNEAPSIGSMTPSRPATPDDRPVEPTAANTPAEPGVEGPAFAEPSTPTAREMQPEPAVTEPQPELKLPSTPEPESPAPPAEVGQSPAAPEPTPQPGQATAPPAPAEPNLFEEVDAAPATPPAAEPEAAADEPPQDPPPVDEPAPPPASEPDAEPAADAAPVENIPEPAAEPADADAVEPAADPLSRSERDRRWIDASGRYAVVGRLVALLDGRAEIQKPDGRSISVPLDRLSPFDRAYAEEAGRLIAGAATARPTDTAGL